MPQNVWALEPLSGQSGISQDSYAALALLASEIFAAELHMHMALAPAYPLAARSL